MKSTEDLTKVFDLIKDGKAKEVDGDLWAAVDSFAQAQTLLTKLHTVAKTEPTDDEEQLMIANLYQRQSREYLHRARRCFLQALQLENEQDEKYREAGNEEPLDNHPPKYLSITQEEAEHRLKNFTILFSKEIKQVVTSKQQEEDADVKEKQSSLEERLLELSKSIPSGFKTSANRILEINQGLRRLGLSAFTEESRPEVLSIPKSEHEQVAEIIAQAKDEVTFDIGDSTAPKAVDNVDDDVTADSDSDDKDDDDDEASESDDKDILMHRKAIRKQVVEAQIELANLVALLDKEPVPLDQAKAENEVDLMRGKKSLADARRYLVKALKLWSEDS